MVIMGGVLGDGLMRSIGEFGEGCQWEKAIGGMSNATQATGTGVRLIVPFGRRRGTMTESGVWGV
jgi:hypothetical protein